LIVFHSIANFDENIRQKIEERDVFISGIMGKPRILAEAIIHTAKNELKVQDLDRVRSSLERYFQPGTMRYREANDIFRLNIYVIYQKAFTSLPVLRQFWMKLTGKYKAASKVYESFRPKHARPERKEDRLGAPEKTAFARDSASKKRSSLSRIGHLSRGKPGARKKRRPQPSVPSAEKTYKTPAPKTPVPRDYSEKQQNQAWEDFRSSLKK
jgi:hypothetical protein